MYCSKHSITPKHRTSNGGKICLQGWTKLIYTMGVHWNMYICILLDIKKAIHIYFSDFLCNKTYIILAYSTIFCL